jgi:hypothetical protein
MVYNSMEMLATFCNSMELLYALYYLYIEDQFTIKFKKNKDLQAIHYYAAHTITTLFQRFHQLAARRKLGRNVGLEVFWFLDLHK